tara:strand:- start:476 stop:661 length:186 start_codon:yes stop_codon:yes gene_type:complete
MANFIKGIITTITSLVVVNQFWQSTTGSEDYMLLQGYLGFAILCLCMALQGLIFFSLKGDK